MRESPDDFNDLIPASESTLEFWDTTIDDLGMEKCLISGIPHIMDVDADEVETILNG